MQWNKDTEGDWLVYTAGIKIQSPNSQTHTLSVSYMVLKKSKQQQQKTPPVIRTAVVLYCLQIPSSSNAPWPDFNLFPVPSLINQFNKILDVSSFHICMRVMILPFWKWDFVHTGEKTESKTQSPIYHHNSHEIHLTHSEKKKTHHLKRACICLEIR